MQYDCSVKSIVLALPYFARMGWHVLWHGNVKPARPEIPAEVMALYTPRPTDVIISPAAKSGTTWLMQIAHQLRVKGAEPTWDDQVSCFSKRESAAPSHTHAARAASWVATPATLLRQHNSRKSIHHECSAHSWPARPWDLAQ